MFEDAALLQALRELNAEGLAGFSPKPQDAELVEYLSKQFHQRTLTLALGAGVSKSAGVPDWDDLAKSLVEKIFNKGDMDKRLMEAIKKAGLPNIVLVRYLEVALQFKSSVRRMLRDRLYQQFDLNGPGSIFPALQKYFLNPMNGCAVDHVISYNFDNLLERHLGSARIGCSVIYSDETYPLRAGGLRIYHPHGFLPHPEDDPDGEQASRVLVFSEPDYHSHYMDLGHWANVLQLHHLMNRACLFIGCSMTDPNMRRLLDHAKLRTGASWRHVAIKTITSDPIINALMEADFQSLGVRILWVAKRTDIPSLLEECCKSV